MIEYGADKFTQKESDEKISKKFDLRRKLET